MPAPAPLNAVAAFATNVPLSDPSLPPTPVSLNLPEQSIPITVPAPNAGAPDLGKFTLGIGASTSIAVINSASDPDPVGFFGLGTTPQSSAENAADGPLTEPPATFDATQAYVVFTGLAVSGKLSGQMTIGAPATLGLDGSGSLDAVVCYGFPADTLLWTAAPSLLPFPTIFSLADLQTPNPAAGPGTYTSRILSFGVQGTLTATLKVTPQSLASTIAEQINAALANTGPLKFDTTVGAAVAFTASITDGYRVFATRAPSGVTFCITKSESTSLGVDGGFGLDINVSSPALNDLVNSAVEQAAQVAAGSVAAILSTPLAGLTPAQQQILSTLLSKLGLPATLGNAQQALTTQIQDLAAKIKDRLQTVVKLQLSYEWKRLTSDSMVARFTVTDAALPRYHAAILSLELDTILNAPAADITIDRFLGRKTTEIDVGYGFSFGIADHVFIKSWDSLQTKFIELDTLNPAGGFLRQFSFLGKREFDGTWFGRSQSNYAEIDASMPVPLPSPTAQNFDVGVSIAFTWTNQRFADILLDVTDTGVVVKAFATEDVNAARDLLTQAGLDPNATGDAVVSLKVNPDALTRLLPALSGPAYASQIAPYALARALPYNPDFTERTLVGRRMMVYAQTWADYLATEDPTVPGLEQQCRDNLAQDATVNRNLVLQEVSSAPWTVRRIGDMEGINALQHAVNQTVPVTFNLLVTKSGDFRSLFPQSVVSLAPLARDTFGCRTFASMLLLAGQLTSGNLTGIERAVTFTWTDADGDHAVAIKTSTSLST